MRVGESRKGVDRRWSVTYEWHPRGVSGGGVDMGRERGMEVGWGVGWVGDRV